MKKNKISVIVAVYNTELYIEKCIDSILNQTYKNLELIIVEDGSSDSSKTILKKYETNSKIKIIYNEKNMGLAYSRNIGIDNATGDYIGFIDSDDYIDNDFYEKMINSIINSNSELSICDIKLIYENQRELKIKKCCEKSQWNVFNILNNGLASSACNKLFKKEIIDKYRFEIGKVNEDIAVVIPIIANSKKASYADNCYYNYVQRDLSIQNSNFNNKKFDIFDGVDLALKRINKNNDYNKIREIIILNQLIFLLLYTIPKESKFFKRLNILKKFSKRINEYNISQSKVLKEYLDSKDKKIRLYYSLLIKLEYKKCCFLANILITMYSMYKNYKKNNTVIERKIAIEDLINLSIKQHQKKDEKIKVTVVVPNYNYEKYLLERLYSILYQDYKIDEIIILDDCSQDNSQELINGIVDRIKEYVNIRAIYNNENTGIAFKQWEKGFKEANGDYVWIAEADDYCKSNMLSNLIKPILKNNDIVISYCNTAFINSDGSIRVKSIKSQIDFQNSGHWNSSYVVSGIDEIRNYAYLNNTIANVSSCIIKNGDYEKIFKESINYRQSGDWIFYVNLMKNGRISYVNKTMNYYRVHGDNISRTIKLKEHFNEIKRIHTEFIKKFDLGNEQIEKIKMREKYVKDSWKID